jgi:hypothetical protein
MTAEQLVIQAQRDANKAKAKALYARKVKHEFFGLEYRVVLVERRTAERREVRA